MNIKQKARYLLFGDTYWTKTLHKVNTKNFRHEKLTTFQEAHNMESLHAKQTKTNTADNVCYRTVTHND